MLAALLKETSRPLRQAKRQVRAELRHPRAPKTEAVALTPLDLETPQISRLSQVPAALPRQSAVIQAVTLAALVLDRPHIYTLLRPREEHRPACEKRPLLPGDTRPVRPTRQSRAPQRQTVSKVIAAIPVPKELLGAARNIATQQRP